MPKQICEISASSWFYYKGICYDARSHERKKSGDIVWRYISFEAQEVLNKTTIQ